MAKKKAPKVLIEKPIHPVTVTIDVIGSPYQGTGNTIMEALADFKPTTLKGQARINVKVGEKQSNTKVGVFFLRRLATNVITREVFQKRMAMLLR